MNIILVLLSVLGPSCIVLARDCLNPDPIKNFSADEFEGDWFSLAVYNPNKTEDALYENSKCTFNKFVKINYNILSGFIEYRLGDNLRQYDGTYTLMKDTEGTMTATFKNWPHVYNFKVLCIDFKKWAVFYACSQFATGNSSEFIALMGRDRLTFSEIISNKEMENCLKNKLNVPLDKLRKTPQLSCN